MRRTVLVVAAATLILTWLIARTFFDLEARFSDVPLYRTYGEAVADGRVPYRDFGLEYPPGALLVMVPPAFVTADLDAYMLAFELLMVACGAAAAGLTAASLARLGSRGIRLVPGVALAALTPLVLGPFVFGRFDLWPAALTALALWALLAGRHGMGLAALGLGTAAKLYPVLLLPIAVTYVARRAGPRRALLALGAYITAVALAVGPLLLLAPGGLVGSVADQVSRPLQIESLGSSVLLALHHVFELPLGASATHGSINLAGDAARATAAVTTLVQAAAVLVVWILFARGRRTPVELVLAATAVTAAFVSFGKVLSPQFLVWLIPLVALVAGREGAQAAILLVAAVVVTRVAYPAHYLELALDFDPVAGFIVLVRNLLLVILAVVLAAAVRRRAASLNAGARRP